MLVKLTCERSGQTGHFLEGELVEVPTVEGLRMIRSGQAVQIDPQTASRPRPQNAAKRPRN
jgi:hypothetical protein